LAVLTMKELLEAGVHFGHQTRRWNPKMKKFIYGGRNGIYIIDLHQTLKRLEEACAFVRTVAAAGGNVLFVGTKKQAQEAIEEAAQRCGMFHVNQRWLGGMLTNLSTVMARVRRLKELREMQVDGRLDRLPKKEHSMLEEEMAKLHRILSGVEDMPGLPGVVFVVDLKKEHIAISEARRLEIPLIGIVDTNCDPEQVNYPVPGNDDAIRAIKLICTKIADSAIEGKMERESRMVKDQAERAETAEAAEAEIVTLAEALGEKAPEEGGEKPAEEEEIPKMEEFEYLIDDEDEEFRKR